MSESEEKNRQKINVELPADLEPKYANFVFITHSAAEVILDFAQILPRAPKGKVQSRIVMTPMHAKLLLNALGQNLQQYESKFGPIHLAQGPSLADQLFKQPPPDTKE
jgi:hypothetical protein